MNCEIHGWGYCLKSTLLVVGHLTEVFSGVLDKKRNWKKTPLQPIWELWSYECRVWTWLLDSGELWPSCEVLLSIGQLPFVRLRHFFKQISHFVATSVPWIFYSTGRKRLQLWDENFWKRDCTETKCHDLRGGGYSLQPVHGQCFTIWKIHMPHLLFLIFMLLLLVFLGKGHTFPGFSLLCVTSSARKGHSLCTGQLHAGSAVAACWFWWT